jgi:hypothetical protein
MELSLAGLVGAMIGTAIGAVNFAFLVGGVESRLRSLDKSQTPQERAEFENKISLMRRIVLGADVFFFGGVGYWIGRTIAE